MQAQLRLLLLLVVVTGLFIGNAMAQSLQPGEWRTYTSMRSISAIAVASDSLHAWAATNGGAFRINLRDSTEPAIALHTTDGLFENDLTAVAADNDGNTYFGGASGAFDEYQADGTIRKLEADIQSFAGETDKKINSISFIGDTILLGMDYGLEIYRKSKDYFPATVTRLGANAPQPDTVRRAVEFADGIYAVATNGLVYAKIGSDLPTPASWSVISDTSEGQIRTVAIFNNTLCVGTTKGIFILGSNQSLIATPFTGSIAQLSASSSALYVLDAFGAVRSTTDLQSFVTLPFQGQSGATTTAIVAAPYVNIVLGSASNGLSYSVNGLTDTNIYPSGPVSNNIVDLDFSPAKDQLFCALLIDGLSSFSPVDDHWKNYDNGTVFPYNTVFNHILYDSIRDLTWAMTNDKLYAVHGFGNDTPVLDAIDQQQSGLPQTILGPGSFVRSGKPMIDLQGRFVLPTWAAQGTGISILDSGSGYHFHNYQIANFWADWGCVTEDQEGDYWVGDEFDKTTPPPSGLSWLRTTDDGFANIAGGSGQLLLSNSVNALLTDQDDEVWCGTSAGLQILSNPYTIRDSTPQYFFRTVGLLRTLIVVTMTVDGVGNKWIGTFDNGIFVLSPDGSDSIAHFTTQNSPLISNTITALVIDANRGEAYAGTPSGISRFSTIFKEGKPDYSAIRVYPNPVTQTTEESPQVYIDGLVAGSTVKIFTTNMRLVKTINGAGLGSVVTWDGRDDLGHQVTSGEYLITATSPQSGNNGAAKIVIIRK